MELSCSIFESSECELLSYGIVESISMESFKKFTSRHGKEKITARQGTTRATNKEGLHLGDNDWWNWIQTLAEIPLDILE